jgi:hydroxymethylpyrimidine pyrophosphatase-like HAD family hydrolase
LGPRLLAVDLDGTLLDPAGHPHRKDVDAIRAALAEGVHVSIVTGRLYSGTRATSGVLGLHGAVGCADGSHLVRASDHATLLHLGMHGAEAKRLRATFSRAGIATFVFARDAVGYDGAGAPFVSYVTTWSNDIRVAESVFEHALWDADQGVTGVVAVGTENEIADIVAELRRELAGVVTAAAFPMQRGIRAGLWATIVRSSAGTKGTALRWIAEHYQVALEDTVCVGDWINDLPMFEVAGRSFAMAQAPEEVKAAATDVLPVRSEEGGGVAHALREAFGIRARS